MTSPVEKLALADAIQLHEERITKAIAQTQKLRQELEEAEAHERATFQARRDFIKAISEHRP